MYLLRGTSETFAGGWVWLIITGFDMTVGTGVVIKILGLGCLTLLIINGLLMTVGAAGASINTFGCFGCSI